MNGIQRFFLCAASMFLVMLCFPHYAQGVGWSFASLNMLFCAGGLLLLSILVSLFGLDRYALVNRIVTIAVWVGFTYYLLLNFPQQDNVSPLEKLKKHQYPTRSDIVLGSRHFTFAFDLMPEVQPNRLDEETSNRFGPNHPPFLDSDPTQNNSKKAKGTTANKAAANAPVKKKTPKKEEPQIEIFMEDEAGYVDAGYMPTKK